MHEPIASVLLIRMIRIKIGDIFRIIQPGREIFSEKPDSTGEDCPGNLCSASPSSLGSSQAFLIASLSQEALNLCRIDPRSCPPEDSISLLPCMVHIFPVSLLLYKESFQ
jgi:hypothetical protein